MKWDSYYTHFHLEQQGCQFCAANLEDLRQQIDQSAAEPLRQRIMQSTIGFFARAKQHLGP